MALLILMPRSVGLLTVYCMKKELRFILSLKTAQQFHASLFKQITSPQGTGKAYKFSLFMEKEESESYVPPAVEVITVNVEEGYSSSFEVVPWE